MYVADVQAHLLYLCFVHSFLQSVVGVDAVSVVLPFPDNYDLLIDTISIGRHSLVSARMCLLIAAAINCLHWSDRSPRLCAVIVWAARLAEVRHSGVCAGVFTSG